MSLNSLPLEVLMHILESLTSPCDLVSLLKASAPCHAAYKLAQPVILESIIRNAFRPEALPHALAVLRALDMDMRTRESEDRDTFISNCLGACDFSCPTEIDLKTLCRFYTRISFFIDDYASHAISLPDNLYNNFSLPQSSTLAASPLSDSERARFERAFLRYDVYCMAFPPRTNSYFAALSARFEAPTQLEDFLSRLKPWEVEEMSCVHFYFTSLAAESKQKLDDQLVSAAFSAPGARTKLGWCDATIKSFEPLTGTVRFKDLDLTNLSLFSEGDHPFTVYDLPDYMASLGSSFMYSLHTADNDERTNLIRDIRPPQRDFLPEALEQPRNRRSTPGDTRAPHPDEDDDDPLIANEGYRRLQHVDRLDQVVYYLPIKRETNLCSRRDRAFVFWDRKRFPQPQPPQPPQLFYRLDNLKEAKTLDRQQLRELYDLGARESAEERLKGLRIPEEEMKKLKKQFGRAEYDSYIDAYDDGDGW